MKKPFKRFQTEYFLKIRKIPTMQSTVSDIKRCFLIQEETMNRKKYYYEITDAAGEVMYMEIDAKPKDPKLLCEFLHIEGTVREITKQEYCESTEV